MGTYRFLVYCGGDLRVETKYLEDACLCATALFEHYYNEPELEITIKRVSNYVERVSEE